MLFRVFLNIKIKLICTRPIVFCKKKHIAIFVHDAGNKPNLCFKQLVNTEYNDNLSRIYYILAKIPQITIQTGAKEYCGDEVRERFSVSLDGSSRFRSKSLLCVDWIHDSI